MTGSLRNSSDDLDRLEAELGPRLRSTFTAVADTVAEPAGDSHAPVPLPPRRRRVALAGLAVGAVLATAAFGYSWTVPGTEEALFSGSIDGQRWWVRADSIPDGCGADEPLPGADIVTDASNWPGQEVRRGSVVYGEPLDSASGVCRPAGWLDDPTLVTPLVSFLNDGGEVGTASAWAVLVSPDVHQVRVTVDGEPGPVLDVKLVEEGTRSGSPGVVGFDLPAGARTLSFGLVLEDRRVVPDREGLYRIPSVDDLENRG